jgi:pilus assembly protein TadC
VTSVAMFFAVGSVVLSALALRALGRRGSRHRLVAMPPEDDAASPGVRRRPISRRIRMAGLGILAITAMLLPFPLPIVVGVVILVGVKVRRIVAARVGRRRSRAIDTEIPQLLDLLAAGSSAGLAAPLALSRAADGLRGPLGDEVRRLTRAVDLGARWKDELACLSDRVELPDLRRAVAVLTRTETLGSSLEEATAELAATVRQGRRAAVTERARAAPVKMLFPLVFLVLPAFLLLTVVPVLLTTVRSIR